MNAHKICDTTSRAAAFRFGFRKLIAQEKIISDVKNLEIFGLFSEFLIHGEGRGMECDYLAPESKMISDFLTNSI